MVLKQRLGNYAGKNMVCCLREERYTTEEIVEVNKKYVVV
jgi:hypothetical protein